MDIIIRIILLLVLFVYVVKLVAECANIDEDNTEFLNKAYSRLNILIFTIGTMGMLYPLSNLQGFKEYGLAIGMFLLILLLSTWFVGTGIMRGRKTSSFFLMIIGYVGWVLAISKYESWFVLVNSYF